MRKPQSRVASGDRVVVVEEHPTPVDVTSLGVDHDENVRAAAIAYLRGFGFGPNADSEYMDTIVSIRRNILPIVR
ncbi:MAG: hypothetical protein FJX48_13330 [Alphaproteobacteria bacterium]|nr:hypothetical protein [Alphaproteobacteria bacterium]